MPLIPLDQHLFGMPRSIPCLPLNGSPAVIQFPVHSRLSRRARLEAAGAPIVESMARLLSPAYSLLTHAEAHT